MKLIEFKGQNTVIAKNQPPYAPLPAHRFEDGRVVFCWKLTWKERIAVLIRGVLWHQVLTFKMPIQPQLITTDKPEIPEASPDDAPVR